MSVAASAVALTSIVALGATLGVAVKPDDEHQFVNPLSVTYRGEPGPAQIEIESASGFEATGAIQTAQAVPEIGLLGVDAARAVTSACDETGTEPPIIEKVVCELSAQLSAGVASVDRDLSLLLLGAD